jgi:hypothetical protein
VTVEGGQAIRQTLNLWADAFDELRVDIEEYGICRVELLQALKVSPVESRNP